VAEIRRLLGPFPERTELGPEILERQDCGSYVREKVSYFVEPGERVSAYVCIPHELTGPAPAVFCHHQHDGNFDLGKSEVVGLAGDPSQAYAAELASRGFVTIAPDAIAFEERNWSPGSGRAEYFELATRLVQGRTLMAKVLHDVSVGLDYLASLPIVDAARLGFIGHSYGGRMALWAPAFDHRIVASVSNCGCIPYRSSLSRETGIQVEFCIPGFAAQFDLEDVIAGFGDCALRISATTDDRWSLGAEEIYASASKSLSRRTELGIYEGEHMFSSQMRLAAYEFLETELR
jgi:dienelactone hydrolase